MTKATTSGRNVDMLQLEIGVQVQTVAYLVIVFVEDADVRDENKAASV